MVLQYVITEWSENPVTVTDFQMDGRSSEYRLRLSSIASTMTLRHSLVLTRQHANISRRDSRMSKFESWTQHREHVPANNILQLAPWPGQHLSRYGVFPVQPHCANARRNRWQEDLRPPGRTRTTLMKTIQQDLKSNNSPWMKQLTWLRIVHSGDSSSKVQVQVNI